MVGTAVRVGKRCGLIEPDDEAAQREDTGQDNGTGGNVPTDFRLHPTAVGEDHEERDQWQQYGDAQ